MRAQIVKRISQKYFLPNLPGFKVKGHLLYYQDMEYLLRGICFDSSAFSRYSFTIVVFVQPLYISQTDIAYYFGNRLGYLAKRRDMWWEYDESQEEELCIEILSLMKKYALPFLEKRDTIKKFLSQEKRIGIKDNINMVEAVSYAHILNGDFKKSSNLLQKLETSLVREISENPSIEWNKEMLGRVQIILGYLRMENHEQAKQKLCEWRDFTLSNLNLE